MTDFSYLEELKVEGNTQEFELEAIVQKPVLIVKPATQENKPYFNAVLRASGKVSAMARKANKNLTEKQLSEAREQDRELYPKHVIVDWRRVVDKKGNEVPFSVENCAAYLKALPDWIFEAVRRFCEINANFVEEIDLEEKAKK